MTSPAVGRGRWLDQGAPTWFDRAACQGWDTKLFFPEARQTAPNVVHECCAGCDVRDKCLDYALDLGLPGVWGGTSENRRKQIRREEKSQRSA